MDVVVYGSLMWAAVLREMLGRLPRAEAAVIPHGFERRRVPDHAFPALTKSKTQSSPVHCLVLPDLTVQEKAIFDLFEGSLYTKQEVEALILADVQEPYEWAVRTPPPAQLEQLGAGDAVRARALAYVWADQFALADELWSPEHDFTPHLPSYLNLCREFASEPQVVQLRRASSQPHAHGHGEN